VGGIGSGKTRFGASAVLDYCLQAEENVEGIVCGLSYPMLRDVDVPALVRQCRSLQEGGLTGFKYEYKRSDSVLEITCNRHDFLWHLIHAQDPDRARGINAGAIWIDEGSLISRQAYHVLRGRLRGYKKLRMWVTSTPKGRKHWLYEYAQQATVIHALTRDNPIVAHLDEELRAVYGSRLAAQELDGEFLDSEAAAFPELNFGELETATRLIVGVDWGFTNEGAAIALAVGPDRMAFVAEVVERGQTRAWWVDRLADFRDELSTRFGCEPTFYADPEDPAAREECRAKVRMLPAVNTRLAGFRALQSVFERGMVSSACKRLIADATACEWALDKLGNPLEGELPDGYPDHTLDAARYAAIAALGKPRKVARVLGVYEEEPAEAIA